MKPRAFRSVPSVVHDIIGEWELEHGYTIDADDRYALAVLLVTALGDEYGTTRIFNSHYTLIPAIGPTLGAA
jgi:hypothetical protein